MEPGRKDGEDSNQILDKLLLRRERFPIDDHQIGMVAFAKGFKVAITEMDESIPVGNDNTPDLPKFYHLHEAIELFALVIETTANVLHPFIDPDGMLVAISLQRFDLICQIGLLGYA